MANDGFTSKADLLSVMMMLHRGQPLMMVGDGDQCRRGIVKLELTLGALGFPK